MDCSYINGGTKKSGSPSNEPNECTTHREDVKLFLQELLDF